jgi:CelD/BcsL family acetyltransferase involved in cellulose biosynthesis
MAAGALVPTPFLRSWWLASIAGATAEFVLFLDGPELIGGVAVERRFREGGIPVFQFMGGGALCPDHLDAVAAPGRQEDVVELLREWWSAPGSRVFYGDGLAEDSLLERAFGARATSVIDVAPWSPLPADPSAYFAARSANLRKSVRKAENRFERLGIRQRLVTGADLPAVLAVFAELQHRRGDRERLLAEMPRLSRAVSAGVAAGEVDVDVLESDDGIVAVWISFSSGGAVHYYQSARRMDADSRDAGTILLLHVVRRAIERGCRELDLLRGAEPYKMRFADRERQVKRLRLAHGVAGHVLLRSLDCGRVARRWAVESTRHGRRRTEPIPDSAVSPHDGGFAPVAHR